MSRRGAPPGNKNAVKHGFYSRSLDDVQEDDIAILKAQSNLVNIFMLSVRVLADQLPLVKDEPSRHRYKVMCIAAFNELMRLRQSAPGSAGRKSAMRTYFLTGYQKYLEDNHIPPPPLDPDPQNS